VRVPDLLYIGGESFRGFDFYGVSPVRGQSKEGIKRHIDNLVKELPKISYLNAEQKEALTQNKDKIAVILSGGKEKIEGDSATVAALCAAAITKSAANNNEDACQTLDLVRSRGKRLGATRAWTGSVEFVSKAPFLSSDAEVFVTVFMDVGSAWKSNRKAGNDETSVECNDHFIRTSFGASALWNSPIGLLSVGYAWPVRKKEMDQSQKFLFGYGIKYN
jgi:outer membrane protein assembly factor BamA